MVQGKKEKELNDMREGKEFPYSTARVGNRLLHRRCHPYIRVYNQTLYLRHHLILWIRGPDDRHPSLWISSFS